MRNSNFRIVLWKYFLGDPVSNSYKLYWFHKNMDDRGRGLFLLYDDMENFENVLRNCWHDIQIP